MKIIVVGSGITGLVSAIDLADAGHKVILIEKNNYITGTLAKLERQFPNDACGMCQIYPFTGDEIPQYCLRRVFYHKGIEILTNTLIEDVYGENKLIAKLRRLPRGVIIERCISCKKCEEVCPIEVNDEFNPIFGKRKAIYTDYPIPFPYSYAIDFNSCTKCKRCLDVCPTNAINLDMKDEYFEIDTDKILITTGFEEINPVILKEYGYSRFQNVITSLELERDMSFTGANLGELLRPSDKKRPKSIAFIQCVGSRDKNNPFCSYVCCMFSLKEINLINRFYPEIKTSIFYMDMRTFGKGYYRYQLQTKTDFMKQRVASIEEDNEKNLIIKYEDEDGRLKIEKFDLVVLSIGQKPNLPGFLIKDEYGYPYYDYITSENKKGIILAGSSSYPKDITDAVIDGHSAVLDILKEDEKILESLNTKKNFEEKKIGIVLCNCFDLIDYDDINLVGYEVLRIKDFCQRIEEIIGWINEKEINHLLISACTPYFLEPLLTKLEIPFEIADVREKFSFTNQDKKGIKFLIDSKLEMLKEKEYIESVNIPIEKRVVVIGGGLSGLTVADELVDTGMDVVIIEKTDKLGGNALRLEENITGFNIQEYLKNILEKLKSKKNIKIMLNEEVEKIKGSLGNFKLKLKNKEEISSGFIVLSTGAIEYKPNEYLYGLYNNILTQLEFEKLMKKEDFNNKIITMIQCVGSRNTSAEYCSRVCCSKAIQNAIKLKEKFKDVDVYVLYRDMMMYGTREMFYSKARELGVVFLRFNEKDGVNVRYQDGEIIVSVKDEILNDFIEIKTDYLVLSTGIRVDNKAFYDRIGIDYDEDGFVKEANVKYKPLETKTPGIYVCGLAHSPRDTIESIKQAKAVSTQILCVLKKGLKSKKRISYTKERFCSGCGFCVDVCPYNARFLDEDTKISKVHSHICQGCGACVSICPSGSADIIEMGLREILSGISTLRD